MEDKILEMAAFFDKKAAGYEAHMRAVYGGRRRMRRFYRLVAEPIGRTAEPKTVLDLGCGTGLELREILRRVPNVAVTGIDLSDRMLALLRRRYQKRLNRICLLRGSFEQVDLPDGAFDYAISVMAMHHFPPDRKRDIYERIKRALKPGGIYVEGDYVVSPMVEREHLGAFACAHAEQGLDGSTLYHLDLPFTVRHQLEVMEQAGFVEIDVVHREMNRAIFIARA